MENQPSNDELKMVRSVAYRVGSKWRSVEVDDVQQTLSLWLVQHMPKVISWRELGDGGRAKLYVSLKREALRYCTRESAARSGQPVTRDNFYNEAMLERALPFMWEQWPETTVRQDPRTGVPIERAFSFSNAITIMADIKTAFYGLPGDAQGVLEERFRDGLTLEEVGELHNIGKEGARKLIQRHLKRMADSLAD